MAILISTTGVEYSFGSADTENTFYGRADATEALTYSGTGSLKVMDVSSGDRINLTEGSAGWQVKVLGNSVYAMNGARTIELGSFIAGETVVLGFNGGQTISIAAAAANSSSPTVYTATPSTGTPVTLTNALQSILNVLPDTIPPTIAITSDKTALNASGTASISFVLSEASSNFDASDITVSGGTLSGFAGSGTNYTAVFTPTAGSVANGVISVGNSKFADAAGNLNVDGADANNQVTITVDTVFPGAPTIGTVAGNDVVNNSEGTAGFAIAGKGEVGATVALNFTSGRTLAGGNTALVNSSGDWTVAVTSADVTAFGQGSETVTAVQRDAAGNLGSAATSTTFTVDTVVQAVKAVTLFAADGTTPVGSYDSIQLAINAATDGQVIKIAAGTYSGLGEIHVNKAVSIIGVDANGDANTQEVIINSTGRTFVIDGTVGAVSISGIRVNGGTEGVSVDGSSSVATVSSVSVTNSTFASQLNAGLVIGLNNPASALGALTVTNVVFDQSAPSSVTKADAQSAAGIMMFGFDVGHATFSEVKVIGGATTAITSPWYGIQIQGAQNNQLSSVGTWQGAGPSLTGAIVMTGVTVEGGFNKNAVVVYNYADISGLSINGLDLSKTVSGWGAALNVDGIKNSYDASGWNLTLGSNNTTLQDETISQGVMNRTISGSTSADILISKTGADTLVGGKGDDSFIGGDGNDSIDGGVGADTAVVYATPTFARDSNGKLTVTTAYDGTDTLMNVESVQQMTSATVLGTKFVIVDAYANLDAAISAATSGNVLVKSGTLELTLSQSQSLQAKGVTTYSGDTIKVTSDITAPTLAVSNIVDSDSDDVIKVSDVVIYTVTFSEDIDSSTVSAADFTNAGTSTVTIGAISETSAGVFSVSVTPTTAGTLQLQVPQGAVIKDIAGNSLNTASAIQDGQTITVDGIAPTLATSAIIDSDADNIISVGETVQYTLTFSEDIDAATVSVADFSNAGTATVIIDGLSKVSPGVFNLSVTATSVGDVRLQIPVGASIADIAGNALVTTSAIVDADTLTVPVAVIKPVILFAADGTTQVGGYDSIQLAINAAADGQVIKIAAGTYSGLGEIHVNKAVSIVGVDANGDANTQEVIINSTGRTFVIDGTVGAVSISGIRVNGGTEGVSVDGSSSVATVSSVSVTNSTFASQLNAGLVIGLNNPASALGALTVTNVVFDQSAPSAVTKTDAHSAAGIMIFGFDAGSATFSNVKVIGGTTTASTSPWYGIQIQGAENSQLSAAGTWQGTGPSLTGAIVMTDVAVEGSFNKNAVVVYNYADITGLSINGLDLSKTVSGWGAALNVDGIKNSYDASAWNLTLGSNNTTLQDEASTQASASRTTTGTSGTDILISKTGADALIGGIGDDTFIGGTGNDSIDGGTGVDTAVVYATPTFGRDGNGKLTVTTANDGTDTLMNVEAVQQMTSATALGTKYIVVDAYTNLDAAISALGSGNVLVKSGTLNVSLAQAQAVQSKGATFLAADNVNVTGATVAELTAASMTTLVAAGVDTFTTNEVINKATYDAWVSEAGSSAAIVASNKDIVAPTISAVSADWGTTLNAAESNSAGAVSVTTVGAENGQVVTLSLAGSSYTGIVNNNSASVLVPSSALKALTDGVSYTLTANVSDLAGNAAAANTVTSFSVDKAAPGAPSINQISSDDFVNAAESGAGLSISGTGEVGATVTFSFSSGAALTGGNTATVQSDGTWTKSLSANQASSLFGQGNETVTVLQRDAAGNPSDVVSRDFKVDTALPNANATILGLSEDSGISSNDYITNKKVQLVYGSLNQSLGSDEKVQVSADGTHWVDASVGGNQWNATVILADGTNTLSTRTIDAAGNVSSGGTHGYTLDNAAPGAPVVPLIADDNDGAVLTNNNTPAMTVTAEAGSTVGVYIDGAFVGNATETAAGSGSFTFTSPTLSDGVHSFSTRATDAAGNLGASSTARAVTVDTKVNAGILHFENLSNGFGSPLNTSDPIFDLQLDGNDAGNVVYQYKMDAINPAVTDVTTWTNIANNATAQNVTGTDGRYDYRAQVTDAAGNVSYSNSVSVKVTATPPTLSATQIPVTALNAGGGNSIGDTIALTLTFDAPVNGLTSGSDSTIFKVGGVGVDATWSGISGTTARVLTYTVAAGQNGAATIDEVALKAVLVANAVNGGGIAFNYSGSISEIDIGGTILPVVDGTPPTAPVIDAVSTDNLINAIENTNGFNLTGTGEVGATVTVSGFSTANKTAVVAAGGTWTIAVVDADLIDNGSNTLTATQTDVAGNVSAAATRTLTTDLVVAVPVINAVSTDNLINVTENTNGFNLTGTGEVGATVTVSGFSTADKTAVVAAGGTWTIAVVDADLADNGSNTLSATQTDVAGNVSGAASRTITTDLVVPTIVTEVISSAMGVQNSYLNTGDVVTTTVTFDEAVLVTGAPQLTLTIGTSPVVATYVGGSGSNVITFSYPIVLGQTDTNGISIPTDALSLNDGSIKDLAGNSATITKTLVADNANFMVDTTVPGTPTIDVLASSDNGASSTDNISSIPTPQVEVALGAGSAVGDIVTLKAGATTVGTFTLTQTEITNGSVTITTAALGAQGSYALKAFVTDAAGNVGSDSNSISFVLDSTNDAPSASFVKAGSTSFTILASDPDFEPNWTTLTLVSPVSGANSVTDGSSTTFNVAQQISPIAIDLSVTDLTNTTLVAVGGNLVTVALGTSGPNPFDAAAGYGVYYGFGGNDILTGGDNGNTFIGGAGSDTLTMGAGVDKVLFDSLSGIDTVILFNPSQDMVQLAKSVMAALGPVGSLTAAEFKSGAGLAAAADATTRVFYNETSGALYYDADGSGATAAVQLATFTGTPTLTFGLFSIV